MAHERIQSGKSVALLQIQSIASRQLITQLLVLTALDHPLGDGVFKYLSSTFEMARQDESDPEFGRAIGREISSLIEQAKVVTQGIRQQMSR